MRTTVFFDLDNTILDFHWAESQALRQALREMGVEPTEEIVARYSRINQSQWELLEQGKTTRQQLLVRRFDILFHTLGVDASSREMQAHYIAFLSQGHKFMPGAEEVLAALSPRYDLYLASNGTASVQAGRLRSANIGRYFKKIFISETMGAVKPQKEFFDQCFAAIPDFCREEAVIVGDSLTSDIQGGNNAGIRTCWYNPGKASRKGNVTIDWEISDLRQLPGLLEELHRTPSDRL